MARRLALGLAFLSLTLVLAPALVAPPAAALHICQPCEPGWTCEHRKPRAEDVRDLIACILRTGSDALV